MKAILLPSGEYCGARSSDVEEMSLAARCETSPEAESGSRQMSLSAEFRA
jgi:hypothetical protein